MNFIGFMCTCFLMIKLAVVCNKYNHALASATATSVQNIF